ncbi:DUF885 domain-containing protein, partial [Pseudolysinimonas sp.]|uniref:DUF885 domain-containing protein n=1 Tax=Pseudolysinimonas sp. TaxID=2680009 RepID=UPI00286BE035
MTASDRTPTPIDKIAEDWVATMIDLDPDTAIWMGVEGRIGEIGDYSPAGHDKLVAEAKKVVASLATAKPLDEVDEVTKTDITSELQLEIASAEAGYHLRDLNVIASPAQNIREIFDLMPTESEADWSVISTRLGNVAGAVDGYIETLKKGIATGSVPAQRQVAEVAQQARKHGDPLGFFFDFTGGAKLGDGADLPASLNADLKKGAEAAAEAYDRLAEFLETELAPAATEVDAVGRELYALRSQHFLGAKIDLDETYEWGIEELARMVAEQTRIAGEIVPGGSVSDAIEALEKDASRKLHGTDELQRWMQATSDQAVADLSKHHFDIPDAIKNLECMIAPTQEGGIYYTGP